MTQLAPSWLPRQQRRRVERELRKLIHSGVCSFCGNGFPHNSHTASGFNARGNVAVAGECCINRLSEIFALGLYSERRYDFLQPRAATTDEALEVTSEQAAGAIAAYQKVIADTDGRLDDVEQRGGGVHVSEVSLLDHPWKGDDRDWFRQNPSRAHRIRALFPDEVDETVIGPPPTPGCTSILLVRQVEPGTRLKTALFINADFLPLPDDEAIAHALFEVAAGREAVPHNGEALDTLIKKYRTRGSQT
jgi:hypothetical protein